MVAIANAGLRLNSYRAGQNRDVQCAHGDRQPVLMVTNIISVFIDALSEAK